MPYGRMFSSSAVTKYSEPEPHPLGTTLVSSMFTRFCSINLNDLPSQLNLTA